MKTFLVRRIAVAGGAGLLGMMGLAVVAQPAGAAKVTFPGVDCQTNGFGDQAIDITVDVEVPKHVAQGETFTVTFPGGTATLPDSALNGAVTIAGYTNLSTSYQILGATYVPGTLGTTGTATINGSDTDQTGTLSPAASPNKAKFVVAQSEIPPGVLVTPTWTVKVKAPMKDTAISFFALVLTTTADISGLGPVPVTCNIPPATLAVVQVGGGGTPATLPPLPTTTTTTTTTTIAPAGPVTAATVPGGATGLPRTGSSTTPLALAGATFLAAGLALVARRRPRALR